MYCKDELSLVMYEYRLCIFLDLAFCWCQMMAAFDGRNVL
jgi:hypothetical protein